MKKILIAPLDWGIGHASRCIPLIREKVNQGHQVHLAANGKSAALLKETLPDLQIDLSIPDYDIRYPSATSFAFYFLLRAPHIFRVIRNEHVWLDALMNKEHYDEIYSDNRYGLYTARAVCHLITHQLHIRANPFAVPVLERLTRHYIRKFSDCLVPDFEGDDNFSGALSHPPTPGVNVIYLGPLSRFQSAGKEGNLKYKYTGIVSGPEPHRSEFEDMLMRLFAATGEECLLICGSPDIKTDEMIGAVRKVSHLNESEFATALRSSERVVCRSGYSTIMDLHFLERKALLVPTPGQTEQEYLAGYHANKGRHACINQSDLDISRLELCPKNEIQLPAMA